MKAIHNNYLICNIMHITVVNKAKIQNESNSQPAAWTPSKGDNCC